MDPAAGIGAVRAGVGAGGGTNLPSVGAVGAGIGAACTKLGGITITPSAGVCPYFSACVGANVGAASVGACDGTAVGAASVGACDGTAVGACVGAAIIGACDGTAVGAVRAGGESKMYGDTMDGFGFDCDVGVKVDSVAEPGDGGGEPTCFALYLACVRRCNGGDGVRGCL